QPIEHALHGVEVEALGRAVAEQRGERQRNGLQRRRGDAGRWARRDLAPEPAKRAAGERRGAHELGIRQLDAERREQRVALALDSRREGLGIAAGELTVQLAAELEREQAAWLGGADAG